MKLELGGQAILRGAFCLGRRIYAESSKGKKDQKDGHKD